MKRRRRRHFNTKISTEEEEEEDHQQQSLCYDLIEQIFCRLPVKSSFRFKSVSKHMRDFISSTTYAKKLLAYDTNAVRFHLPGCPRSYYIDGYEPQLDHALHELPRFVSLPSVSVSPSLYSSSKFQIVELGSNPFQVPFDKVRVLGSCNGLFLLHMDSETYLWNPSIREHVKLSPRNDIWEVHYSIKGCDRLVVGLGYNALSDEYKAVLVSVVPWRSHAHRVFIFSSRVGYWKETRHVSVPFLGTVNRDYFSETTVNGYPHWLILEDRYPDSCSRTSLVYFDTGDDTFKTVPTPQAWQDEYRCDFYVFGQLGSCLYAAKMTFKWTDIWVMAEHGVGDSWAKLFSIPHTRVIYSIKPLGFTRNSDEVVLEVAGDKIVVYNLKTKEHTFVVGTACPEFNSYAYIKSSVLPRCLFKDMDS